MSKQRGQTLVATIVVLLIIGILAAAIYGGTQGGKSLRQDGHGVTPLGASRYAAKDDVCRSNLQQVREAIEIARSSNGDEAPQSLQDTKLPKEFYSCPIDKEPYQYDPATGKVHCVHPGHEKY